MVPVLRKPFKGAMGVVVTSEQLYKRLRLLSMARKEEPQPVLPCGASVKLVLVRVEELSSTKLFVSSVRLETHTLLLGSTTTDCGLPRPVRSYGVPPLSDWPIGLMPTRPPLPEEVMAHILPPASAAIAPPVPVE